MINYTNLLANNSLSGQYLCSWLQVWAHFACSNGGIINFHNVRIILIEHITDMIYNETWPGMTTLDGNEKVAFQDRWSIPTGWVCMDYSGRTKLSLILSRCDGLFRKGCSRQVSLYRKYREISESVFYQHSVLKCYFSVIHLQTEAVQCKIV